jgi:hypothetical protein
MIDLNKPISFFVDLFERLTLKKIKLKSVHLDFYKKIKYLIAFIKFS